MNGIWKTLQLGSIDGFWYKDPAGTQLPEKDVALRVTNENGESATIDIDFQFDTQDLGVLL